MTYMSLHVLAYGNGVTPEELARSDSACKVLADLSTRAREVGPSKLSAWAMRHALPIHYVDSCWVRVEASRQELTAFLHSLGLACNLPLQMEGAQVLVIQAEEF